MPRTSSHPSDFYAVLGISKTADDDQIKRAYRDLARRYHPDTNKSPGAEARFKEVQNAYEVLKDPERRRFYDQFGTDKPSGSGFDPAAHGPVGGGGAGSGGGRGGRGKSRWGSAGGAGAAPGGFEFNVGDPFADIFGGGFGRGWQSGRSPHEAEPPSRGSDVETELSITLRESAIGDSRTINISTPSGEKRSLEVTIPAGIADGAMMRLIGQGQPAPRPGAAAGDLLIKVRVLPDSRFTISGSDLVTIVPIAPHEAALGCQATVPTLEGDLVVTVPAHSSSGQRLRLRAKGLPVRGTQTKGDLFVELRIVLPKSLSADEIEAYKRLAELSNFSPRPA